MLSRDDALRLLNRSPFEPFVIADHSGKRFLIASRRLMHLVEGGVLHVFQPVAGDDVMVTGPTYIRLEDVEGVYDMVPRKAG